ncbi:hypothetical protein QD409_33660, partial [Rhizobium sp. BR 315]
MRYVSVTSLAGQRRHVGVAATKFALLLPAIFVLSLSLGWPLLTIIMRSLNEKGRSSFSEPLYFGHYAAIVQDDLLRQVA